MAYAWFILAVTVGVLAHTRGRNIIGWSLVALLVSPLLAGIILMALPNPKEEQARREAQADEDALEFRRARESQAVAAPKKPSLDGAEMVLSFVQLRQLLEKGILNDDEYAGQKAEVLKRLKSAKLKDTPENVLALMSPLAENGTITGTDLQTIKTIVLGAREATG